MKRHPALIPLSRDHHGSLILARLLQKNAPAYKGLPTDLAGKRKYAVDLFLADIRPHFEKEERLFDAVFHHEQLQPLIDELRNEHLEISSMFERIMGPVDLEDLDRLGTLLERHIRKEDRQLFQLMENICTEEELAVLDTL